MQEKPMKPRPLTSWRPAALAFAAALLSHPPEAAAQQQFIVKPIAEKRLSRLPAGPLYWRIETFPTLAQAQAAGGPTSLAAEVAGKVWLFTLGPKGGRAAGATEIAEIGPIPTITAPEYLLRINDATGSPGAKTPVHAHPGSETFYVLSGELSQKTPEGTKRLATGEGLSGHATDTPMEVFSTGTGDLEALVMFVVDATRPFSSPARFK
jgi:mannose-6-phosphate isomerase-like protein (cupin superfamily)